MAVAEQRRTKVSRDAITLAAWALFEEIGYDATTMTAIAERAGVSRRTLFNHVEQKAALLYIGVDEFLERFAHTLSRRAAGKPPFTELLDTFRELASVPAEILEQVQPGPEVRAAQLRPDVVDYWKTAIARKVTDIFLEIVDPDEPVKARLVGAIAGQLWTEFTLIQRDGSVTDVNTAVESVLRELDELVYGTRPDQ